MFPPTSFVISATSLKPTIANDSIEVSELLKKHQEVFYSDTTEAARLLESAISLAKESEKINLQVLAFNAKSKMYLIQGKLPEAYRVINQALNLENKLPEGNRVFSSTYSNLGHYYYYRSEYEKGIEAHIMASKIAERFHDSISLARSYNNIGNIYIKLEDYPKSLSYYKQAYEIAKQKNYSSGLAHILGNLGIVYNNMDLIDSAKNVIYESLRIHRQLNARNQEALNYSNLGRIYEKLSKLDSALYLYKRFYDVSDSINDAGGKISALLKLSNIALKQNKSKVADTYLNTTYPLLMPYDSKGFYSEYYFLKSEFYSQTKNFQAAFEARQAHETWKDSMINENHLKEIEKLEIQYETEKNQNEILQLSQQNLIHESTIASRNRQIRNLIIGFFVLLLIGVLVFILFNQRIKNRQQIMVIDAISKTQEKERQRIATALHDSIGSSLAGIKLQLEDLDVEANAQSKNKNVIQLIDDTAKEVRRISHDLIPGVLLKLGLVDGLKDAVNQINRSATVNASLESFGMEKRLQTDLEVKLFRICQELIQNSLKHARAKNINIHLTKHPHAVNIIVDDDGIGFDTSSLKNDGIGIMHIKNQVSNLKGTIQLESAPGKGTTVIIDLPV